MQTSHDSLSREIFHQRLNSLINKFSVMEPELEITLRDTDIDLEGFVVVWNTDISKKGPLKNCSKGGTRLREGLSLSEIKMLAKKMAIKNAAAGLPLGGCKSGINANPKCNSFEKKYRRFVELCKPFIHENGGSFGGFGYDIGASPEHALWACDTLRSTKCFTGKPIHMGGTDYDKEGIAGLGVAEAAAQLLRIHSEDLVATRFAVHGVGAMGSAVIRYLSELGPQLGCIGDPKFGGTWELEGPISQELLIAIIHHDLDRTKSLLEIQARYVDKDPNAVLFSDCDLLLPCAMHDVITADNFSQLKSRYIVEGANNPCSANTYQELFERGITHIPDFIANAGGVIAAFVEMTSDTSDEENARTTDKVKEAKQQTRDTIRQNVDRIIDLSQRFHIPLHDAGMYLALEAIFCQESKP